MKTRFTWFGIIAAVVIGITAVFVSCQKELNDIVRYRGEVVYINTTNPFPNLTVKVTNGRETHCQTLTDEAGLFELKVKVNEIDGNYYLLAGDSTCIPKQVALGGYGQAEVDLGTIEVEGPSTPTVETSKVTSITADGAICGGNVITDGRLHVTARGVCYGTENYPTIDGLHTTDGNGLGEFTSTLKDLKFRTIYYARAYATNSMGTAYGQPVKFTTEEGVAIVLTDSVIRITAHSARCVGHVESDGGFAVTQRGTCWSKRPDPTVADECTNDGSGLGEFTSAMNNLQPNTTYYVRTYATNSTTTSYGEQIIITTLDGLAVVTTDSINTIKATSFTAFGTVVSDCDIPVTARGFCYSTSQYPTIDDEHTTASKGLGSFRSIISGLEYSTTYYVRAYATNETETSYGEQVEVTTLSGLPTVTTDSVTNIGSVKATCGGNVTDDGSLNVTARGVCYGTEQMPTIEDNHTTDGKGLGKFTSNIRNLEDQTTYYVRAYATTDAGTAYGVQRTFVTKNGIPVVTLDSVGIPTANSVTCSGNVTGDGGVSITERGFCYSTSQYPSNTDSHVAIGTGTGEFVGSLTGLNVNTTYYVRAYAVNALGVGYSAQQSFKTLSGLPTVTTAIPTATATTINAGGEVTDNGGYAVSERGVCYSTTNSEPTIVDQKVVSGRGNGTFTLSIAGLDAATTFYVRAYATNENGTAYGNALTIVTKNGAAIVTAGTITNITALSATGSVTVSDAGGANLQSCGICWATTPNPTIENNKVVGGNQINTAYSCNMTNLSPNTTYYVRAYATTDISTAYSEQVTFSTVSGLPVVTTGTPIPTATTITASGDVTDNGGYNVTERGFCYSATNSEPTLTDSKIISGSGNGTFNASISNLTAATIYYVRAYATNSIGTAYGSVMPVMTKNGSSEVIVGTITNITALSATSSVKVTDAGGANLQSCGVCWATTANPTISDNMAMADGKQLNTAYSCNMTGLTPNTTYYVRAYATTDITTSYSEQISFSTVSGLPAVTTSNVASMAKSLTVTSEITDNGGYNVSERGVCYSTTNAEPKLTDAKVINGSGNGSFNTTISSLSVSTQYYVRAYATNEIGTAYGNVLTTTTKDGRAKITMGNIDNVTTTTAVGHVTTTDNGGATLQSSGLCWSTNPNPTIADQKVLSAGNQLNTAYACNMSGLSTGTTYNVRAFATTDVATVYSAVKSFTTMLDVSGVVKSELGQVISNATVTFKNANYNTKTVTTNTNGQFSIQLVPSTYTVDVTATGYSKLSQTVTVGTSSIELVMRPLGILYGIVLDDDNIPLANATVKVKSSVNNTTYTGVSNSDGSYTIENIPLGQTTSITCSLSGYELITSIPNREINSGNNNLNIQMRIITPSQCSPSAYIFDCTNDGLCGTTASRTFNITNNRQTAVSWSLTGVPSKGLQFSPSSGTIPAKSSVIVTMTFTFPGPSVSGSVKTTLSNCILNSQRWTYTYLWNWSTVGWFTDCNPWCSQEVNVIVGTSSHKLDVSLFQSVVWR